MKDSLSKLHPAVLLTYFISQAVLTAVCFHPVFLCISLLTAFLYAVLTTGAKPALTWIGTAAIYICCFGLINPLINHQGETVLFIFRNRPITLQAVAFGVFAGVMLCAVCLWLYIMSKTISGRQYAFLLGGKLPAISLISFISVRLIKRYTDKYSQIVGARKGMYPNEGKTKRTLSSLETLLTFALENGVETADSMAARGYGTAKPAPYYSYSFAIKDYISAAILVPLSAVIIYGISKGACKMYFYPAFFTETTSFIVIIAYVLFCLFPTAVYLWSEIKWKLTK